jgi:hypothetical protein
MEGVEPTHPYGYQILSLARLPIPPHRPNRLPTPDGTSATKITMAELRSAARSFEKASSPRPMPRVVCSGRHFG